MKKKSSEYLTLYRQMTSYVDSEGHVFICLTCEVTKYPFEKVSKVSVGDSFFNEFRMMRLPFKTLLYLFGILSMFLCHNNIIRKQNGEKICRLRITDTFRQSVCYYPSDDIPF